jgi:ankyrin repeat protein
MSKKECISKKDEFNVNGRYFEDGQAYLHVWASQGELTGLKLYIEGGGNVNQRDNNGATPIHYASYFGHMEAVRKLFNAGAKPDQICNGGRNAADFAREGGHEFLARYIAKRLKTEPRLF